MSEAATILGPNGPFHTHLKDFRPREVQRAMAARIEQVFADNGVFVAESGTGTGKTYAYLVPAILSRKKILISTGTKHLQDQIFGRDLPRVREVLAIPVTAALLKGRANYVCLHRLEQSTDDTVAPEDRPVLGIIRRWAAASRSGDISEVADISEDAAVWSRVISTPDNCLGANCPRYDDCFVRRARKAALEADILVVNHHLFFADLVLKEEGFGHLLPGVDAIVFDEAHQLPDVASVFFGIAVSRAQLDGLARDTVTEELRERSGVKGLRKSATAMEQAVADFRLVFGKESTRGAWDGLKGDRFHAAFDRLLHDLNGLSELLQAAAPAGDGLGGCAQRANELLERLYMLKDGVSQEYVAWYESNGRGFAVRMTPLDVSQTFSRHEALAGKSLVFTSATLAINGGFEHFVGQLGLADAETAQWDSPFDYGTRSLLYLPPGLPEPNDDGYTDRVLDAAMPVIEASGGRAFLLFTSYRALRIAEARLRGGLRFPVLVQGDAPKDDLLKQFRARGNAVLLGTSSFWEGVDVRGEALSCVVIDKLPFAAPDDPVLRARARAMEEQGVNPFLSYQLPQAVIALKQGAGRLIRDEQDYGVLVLCDPRLRSKGYGKIFLNSLPPMPVTRELAQVQELYRRFNAAGPATAAVHHDAIPDN